MKRFIVPLAAFAVVAASIGASAQPDKGGSDLQQTQSQAQPSQTQPQPSQTQPQPQAQSQPVQPQTPTGVMADPHVQIESKALIGSIVSNSNGKDIGKVTNLLIDPNEGRIKTVVISMGGRLGMGGKEVAVPWTDVKLGRDQYHNVIVSLQRDLLETAPGKAEDQSQPPKK